MRGYLIVLSVAVGTTVLLTPLVRHLAIRLGAVVRPDERRVHERPTPTLGRPECGPQRWPSRAGDGAVANVMPRGEGPNPG